MPISGKEMLNRYKKAGWKFLRQNGSHVIIGKNGLRETIPLHDELKKGLERYLLKRLERGD
jgi:predicted RNA binding protein YcfA (HicA-like mRNA interferase family)